MIAVVATLVLVAIGLLVWTLTSTDAGPRFDSYTPFATEAGYQSAPAWSPDGNQIAYEAEVNGIVQIFTRSLDSPGRTQVTNRPPIVTSPDGLAMDTSTSIRRQVTEEGLFRVSPIGGSPEFVLERASGSAISPDAKTIFFLRDSDGGKLHFNLWSATLPDAETTKRPYTKGIFKDINTSTTTELKFSPDGSKLLIWVGPGPEGDPTMWEIPMNGGEPRPLLGTLLRRAMAPLSFSWVDNRNVVVARADGVTPGEHLWLAEYTDDVQLVLLVRIVVV